MYFILFFLRNRKVESSKIIKKLCIRNSILIFNILQKVIKTEILKFIDIKSLIFMKDRFFIF